MEDAMTTRAHHIHHRSIHDGLHPLVYRSIIGLTLWLVLSIWAFFSTGAYVELTLAMITVFFVVVVAIPVVIWMTWHHNAAARETRTFKESFRDWASEDFATWTGGLSGREAAIQILLPIAAVSIGMTIFGLVFYLAVPNSGY
jgi:cobalamin synthase